jgi:hypothetical protein
MKPDAQDNFARNSTRVRSPISHRRARRLARFAALSLLATLAGVGLLLWGIGGI